MCDHVSERKPADVEACTHLFPTSKVWSPSWHLLAALAREPRAQQPSQHVSHELGPGLGIGYGSLLDTSRMGGRGRLVLPLARGARWPDSVIVWRAGRKHCLCSKFRRPGSQKSIKVATTISAYGLCLLGGHTTRCDAGVFRTSCTSEGKAVHHVA